MSAPAENPKANAIPRAIPLDVMVVDKWLIFDCPHCSQTIKLDRKDSVHNIECPACASGFEPLLDREVKLPPRKVPVRKRRRRGPRGGEESPEEEDPVKTSPRSLPTASSLPADGVVRLTLTRAEASEEEAKEAPPSRLPVRSALDLERRRVESLETRQSQPDERELDAVIEQQSGGKYKRIRVRTRKKRLTEKQRVTKLFMISGGAAVIVVGLSLYGASRLYKSDAPVERVAGPVVVEALADAEPIGAVIGNRTTLLQHLLKATTVDQLLKLIRHPKRLEPAVRAHYGGDTLPRLNVKQFSPVSGAQTSLPKDFSRYQMLMGSKSLPIYIEKTETHGYRLDWESFVGLGTMPWDEFVQNQATRRVRMRAYLSDADYFEGPFNEQRYHCLRIEDPTRTQMVYGYYDRNDISFRRLTEKIFAAKAGAGVSDLDEENFELAVILDIRYPASSSNPYQVEILEFVTDSWLRP